MREIEHNKKEGWNSGKEQRLCVHDGKYSAKIGDLK